jgi:hypothetical protein
VARCSAARIVQVRATGLPHLHAFARGLDRDRDDVIAALTLPSSSKSRRAKLTADTTHSPTSGWRGSCGAALTTPPLEYAKSAYAAA